MCHRVSAPTILFPVDKLWSKNKSSVAQEVSYLARKRCRREVSLIRHSREGGNPTETRELQPQKELEPRANLEKRRPRQVIHHLGPARFPIEGAQLLGENEAGHLEARGHGNLET